MQMNLTINMENDAFRNCDELPRLLRNLARKIETRGQTVPGDVVPCMDYNGNRVGEARFEP